MANKPTTLSGKIQIILDGIHKLYVTNKTFSWFLILMSLIGFSYNLSHKHDYKELGTAMTTAPTASASSYSPEASFGILLFLCVLLFAVVIAIIYIQGMIAYISWRTTKNDSASIKEAFEATKKKFWVLVGASIIATLKTLGGLILFIIPGIRAICRYWIVYFVVFDKNLSATDTIEHTKKITKGSLTIPLLSLLSASILSPISYFIQYGAMVGYYPTVKLAKPKKK